MTESHRAVISRLSEEFEALSRQMSRVSGELTQLDRLFSQQQPAPPAAAPAPSPPPPPPPPPYFEQHWPYWTPPAAYAPPRFPAPVERPAPPPVQPPPSTPRAAPTNDTPSGWIGKLLAVAGVAVTLIGVVLLLVLAAQAGLLRPEIRVTGGVVLSTALIGMAARLRRRPGGRIGAIAMAATGIAAAYLDVLALTTIYHWVSAPVGLILAAIVGGAGLTLARRWDSQELGLLVLVPLIALAPVVTKGVDLLLVSFMLALSAAALPVQLGKDWIWMHAARIAATTLPMLAALVALSRHDNPWLVGGACGVAAVLAIVSGLILLPSTENAAALALLTAIGTVPVLAAGISVDRALSAVLAAALAAGMLAVVLVGDLPRIVVQVWSGLSAISALIAVTVAFDGHVAGPVLLALAVIIAIVGQRSSESRWAAAGLGVVGVGFCYGYTPPTALMAATVLPTPVAVSTLASSVLVIAFAILMARAWLGAGHRSPDAVKTVGAVAGALVIYAVTAFTVTAGVLVGGTSGGFLAGHMAATICWIAMAAALFRYAQRPTRRVNRTAPITAGLALTGAATAKLFLFDLATLDGIFRVAVFIVVGLVLLSMGAGYARSLAQQSPAK
ncbi:hypothetical protein MKUB_50490 [Mycobacterium kubicae]|uniref:DUF2339 domain-containing protein n=1 Tax=Mycobacterium kubicae TaxID=120959 RepID=A0AAX1J4X1_9MYCO|nr:DUF2339 domain-containing protein [Mycobacterium kubicae]MCV7094626.1 DUF2339 domain-containing protein [Mycobacterium kubicae]ORV97598.1 hypothetical protein AWC13_15270 [Mycobacterium kubicae]QNI12973.1 DUF2339 domain-containing protein [Mycobacterium kubicae]QPI36489.1 DUF2339 domain-containing protein [Mycobacterium kubicae]GFG67559.1 hypothetical protein MKUB_50490 [Mycobacterium kubicae]